MYELTLCFGTFQAFPASSFDCFQLSLPKVRFLYIFSAYMEVLRPRQIMHREILVIELEAE